MGGGLTPDTQGMAPCAATFHPASQRFHQKQAPRFGWLAQAGQAVLEYTAGGWQPAPHPGWDRTTGG